MNSLELKSRWLTLVGKQAIAVICDPDCSKKDFFEMLGTLYPQGDWEKISDTHRGPGKFIDFRGLDLSGKNLEGVDFIGCDLSFANFENANIEGAFFNHSKLYESVFRNTSTSKRTEFFECYAKCADFENARLVDANFCNADLCGANFKNAFLRRCDFTGARLQDALLDNVVMMDCDVGGLHIFESHRNADWFKASTFRRAENILWCPVRTTGTLFHVLESTVF